eukprot:scaffold375_cov378-Prasinococcus_capsulatus_cf.AAC.8
MGLGKAASSWRNYAMPLLSLAVCGTVLAVMHLQPELSSMIFGTNADNLMQSVQGLTNHRYYVDQRRQRDNTQILRIFAFPYSALCIVGCSYVQEKVSLAKTVFGTLVTTSSAIRIKYVSPVLQVLIGFSAFLSALVAADRLFHFYIAIFWQKISRKRPEDYFNFKPLPTTNLKEQASMFPMVVAQIPMFNEKAVCEQVGRKDFTAWSEGSIRWSPQLGSPLRVIDACCEMTWPSSRLLVQVLDDSTCEETRRLVEDKVLEWRERGVNIENRWRSNRKGYKAGALMEAERYIADYEYTAIFDADFRPEPDFLLQTIPYLKENPKVTLVDKLAPPDRAFSTDLRVGFVQSRWVYANTDESMLTKVQEISLNYHIKCEQYARFSTGNFFNFNGTAGVWRKRCIEDAGGWNNRTTVEDMDLSLRAYLAGWKFVFLNDVTCVNELPSSYDAYRKQQHRWSCGPMQLWRKAMNSVWNSKIPFVQKLYLNIFFFGTRLFATHIVSFVFYCSLVPIAVYAPEVSIPFWSLVYVPIMVTLSTVVFTPRSWYHCAHYVLFENAMSVVKITAMLSGLFELSDSHQWIVTEKTGSWLKKKKVRLPDESPCPVCLGHGCLWAKCDPLMTQTGDSIKAPIKKPKSTSRKVYKREIAMAFFVLACGMYGIFVVERWEYSVFLILQRSVVVTSPGHHLPVLRFGLRGRTKHLPFLSESVQGTERH